MSELWRNTGKCGSVENTDYKNKKAAAATAAAILCLAALVVIIPNLNPKGKYQSLIEQGKTKEAEMLYQEKISSNEKLSKELK